MTLVEGWLAQGLVILLSLGVGAVLVWYALATTYSTLQTGAPDDPLPVIPADAVEAWNVSDPWQVAIVKNRILTTYAEWLTTPAPALAVAAYPATPMLVLGTSPGDDLYQPTRASLI